MDSALNSIGVAIIGISLALTLAVGLWAGRNQDKTARGYSLAAGRLPWWIVGTVGAALF